MQRGRGVHAGLTRERVLDAAHALASEEGLAAVTIRAVAGRLGVVPNAIYAWIPDKAALLDGLVDDALADLPGGEQQGPVEDLLLDLFDTLLAHHEVVPLLLSRQYSPGPRATEVRARLEARLRAAGGSAGAVAAVTPLLLVHTFGFVAMVVQTDGHAALLTSSANRSARELYLLGVRWLISGALA